VNFDQLLQPSECPQPLRDWANSLMPTRKKRSGRMIAGWRWDGQSNEIVLLYAPSGHSVREIPPSVWYQTVASDDKIC